MEKNLVLVKPNWEQEHHLGNRLNDWPDHVCEDYGQIVHVKCMKPAEFEKEKPTEVEVQAK